MVGNGLDGTPPSATPIFDAAQCREEIKRSLFLMQTATERSGTNVEGWMRTLAIGRLSVVNFRSTGGMNPTARRSWREIREDQSQCYLFSFANRGALLTQSSSGSAVTCDGQWVIVRSDQPYSVQAIGDVAGDHDAIWIAVPSGVAHALCPSIDTYLWRPLPLSPKGQNSRIVRKLFQALCEDSDPDDCSGVEELAISGLKTVIGQIIEPDHRNVGGRSASLDGQSVMDYVDRHLSDPDLNVAKAAQALRVSRGYVHHVLRRSGTTFNGYMWQRRVENAATKLRDPAFAGRNIAEIAYLEGFKSAAHFSRSFKQRFEMSPSGLRNQGLKLSEMNRSEFN